VAAFVPEAIVADLASLGEAPEPGFDALLAGPGIGSDAAQAIEIVRTSATPTVLDADALNHLARTRTPEGALALPRRETIVWTPHPGEFHRLTGATPRGDTERLDAARAFVGAHGGVLVLKGHRTVVASRRGFAINTTGNPGMATAGAGDVLSGILVALLGQGYDAFDAARLAAHVHGLAGDLAAERLGVTALVARDLIDHLPEAWRRVERGEPPRHHQP
jgi:NAD(P)H-hydrate epimerase